MWFKSSHAVGAREAGKLTQEEKERAAKEHLDRIREEHPHKNKSHDHHHHHQHDHDEVSYGKRWAFDSFEGIPIAGEFDDQQPGIGDITHDKFAPIEERLVSSGITAHSLESVIRNFEMWELPIHNVEFVKGWFQHTIEETSKRMGNISVLRLDGDLHESTLVCLKHLYPKVSKGGIVIIDDYALTGCRIAVEQYFKSIRRKLPEMISVDGHGVVFFVKP